MATYYKSDKYSGSGRIWRIIGIRARALLSTRWRFCMFLLLLLLFTLLLILASDWQTIYRTIRLREWSIYRWRCITFMYESSVKPYQKTGPLWPYSKNGSGASDSRRPVQTFQLPLVDSPRNYISHAFHPTVGIGNLLFMYAALWGIAKKNHLIATIGQTKLHDVMEIELPPEDFFDLSDCDNHLFGMEECCIYDEKSESISQFAPKRNISLWGYYQSHKYFHPEYRDDIRRQMKFKPGVVDQARAVIDRAITQSRTQKNKGETKEFRPLVGVHIRRGDVLDSAAVKFGHTVPSKEYYGHAVDFLRAKEVYNPIYVVCTNDADWARQNLQISDMYLVQDQGPVVDLAILSMTDHLILSGGTYSFFAGYLSDAQTVIYYARWPAPGSKFAEMTNLEEFWLPEWIPLE